MSLVEQLSVAATALVGAPTTVTVELREFGDYQCLALCITCGDMAVLIKIEAADLNGERPFPAVVDQCLRVPCMVLADRMKRDAAA